METGSETLSIVKSWNRLWNFTIQCMETCWKHQVLWSHETQPETWSTVLPQLKGNVW